MLFQHDADMAAAAEKRRVITAATIKAVQKEYADADAASKAHKAAAEALSTKLAAAAEEMVKKDKYIFRLRRTKANALAKIAELSALLSIKDDKIAQLRAAAAATAASATTTAAL